MPRPSSSTAQAGESETLLLRCLARQHPAQPSPGSRQPDFYFFMLASAQPQPSTTAKLPTVSLHPAGAGAGPGAGLPHQCVISPLSLHPAPPRSHGPLLQHLYLHSYTESIHFTQCQSSIQYSMSLTGTVFRYLAPGYGI